MNLRAVLGLGKSSAAPETVRPDKRETPQERFYAVLKSEFFPKLRAAGFKGSGQNFCRVIGEVIHAINIQGNRWGGSCIVNLGAHVSYLPAMGGKPVGAWKYKVIDCEFNGRIVDPSSGDWWQYGSSSAVAESSARSLVTTYFAEAEPKFSHYSTVASFLAAMETKANGAAHQLPILGTVDFGPLPARAALAAARIHRHEGNVSEARRFARMGLEGIAGDAGIALRPELEALAAAPASA